MGLFGHKGGLSKLGHAAKKIGKGIVKNSIINPLRAGGHLLQAGGYLMSGKLGKAGIAFSKASGEYTSAVVGTITGGVAPNFAEKAGQLSSAVTSYGTLNFNRGSQYVEDVTGYDLDNSKAEAEAARIAAAEQAEIDKANALAEQQRRANLLSLRKQVGAVNIGSKSTVFSGGSTTDNKNTATGIVLG